MIDLNLIESVNLLFTHLVIVIVWVTDIDTDSDSPEFDLFDQPLTESVIDWSSHWVWLIESVPVRVSPYPSQSVSHWPRQSDSVTDSDSESLTQSVTEIILIAVLFSSRTLLLEL